MDIIVGIIMIIFIFGNLMLFSGNIDGVEGLVGLALILDIVVIVYIIKFIYESIKKKQAEEKRIHEEKEKARKQEIIRLKKQQTADLNRKINLFIKKYKPNMNYYCSNTATMNFESKYLNTEIIMAVNEVKKNNFELAQKCLVIDSDINKILNRQDFESLDNKYEYLLSQESILQELKKQRDGIYRDILNTKIQLINEDEGIMRLFKVCFTNLKESQKIRTSISNVNDIFCDKRPIELNLFKYNYEPNIIFIEEHFFCFFSNLILIFDKRGIFSTSLDTSALSIVVNRLNEDVSVRNNSSTTRNVDSDSKLISKGKTRTTWMYTCLDGSPDLRRKYNPSIEYRTDIYQYGKIDFSIAGIAFFCIVSSQAAIDSFEALVPQYENCYTSLHNPIPNYIRLLKILSDDALIAEIDNRYSSMAIKKSYFYKIITL